jgi:uncharacterized protein (TIGR03083 family)
MDVWGMARAERQQLADRLATLTDEEWERPTLCSGWTVRDVVGHMTAIGTMSAGIFFGGMARNRFSFDKFQGEGIRSNTEGKSPSQILAAFGATVDSHAKPPGPKLTVLGEILVHGEDIFRAEDQGYLNHPGDHVVAVADFYKRNRFPLKVKARIAGVTLRMTDSDWVYGSGPEVSGPGISILMAMVGRKVALGELRGDGVPVLSGRS